MNVMDHGKRLEYLRAELSAERISYGELAELQSLAEHIPAGDTELLEAAGVPESTPEPHGTAELPAIIGYVNHGYKIIAAVPTDLAAREFVVCGVAVEDRHDKACTWRLSTADGKLLFWSGDYYLDRDTAMADMLTRARLT